MASLTEYFGWSGSNGVEQFLSALPDENTQDATDQRIRASLNGFVDSQRSAALTHLANERLTELSKQTSAVPTSLRLDLVIPLDGSTELNANHVLQAQGDLQRKLLIEQTRLGILASIDRTRAEPRSGSGDVLLGQAEKLVDLEQSGVQGQENSLRVMQFSMAVNDTQTTALGSSHPVLREHLKALANDEGITQIPAYSKG